MEIIGTINHLGDIRFGISPKTNNEWKSRDIVIVTEDKEHPQSICLTLLNDNCTRFNLKEGQKVKVLFSCQVTKYNGKFYNNLNAWKVDIIG